MSHRLLTGKDRVRILEFGYGNQGNMATEQLIKILAQTSGRDKIYRSIQYGGKFLWWSLEQQGDQDEIVKKLKILETHLSTGRKLFRIANSISLLKAALTNMQNDDVVLRLVVTLSKLNSAFYLLFDHIIWANRIGLVKVDQKYYSKLSNRFWLATLILNLTRDLYEFLLLANDLPQLAKECGENGQSRRFSPTDDSFGRHNNNGTLNGVPRRRVNWHSDVTDHVTDRVSQIV
ncbi:putative peroxisomal membrane protein 11B isoform X2 [Apostichopus japonicus]|uniref:Putative peroxisomal membrane protein 11B isoform X2 n=1 Tax=Stichopus japonicus TaxID=307972 RepID=A0A2G8LAM1_STIJA|nr:putative peroxisomal membrane protein 11B isoform X2 [Apostichopus japonicus]